MADFRDIEKICKRYKVEIFKVHEEMTEKLFHVIGALFISRDWIDACTIDDNAFMILIKVGYCVYKDLSGQKQKVSAIEWAIERAKELGLSISYQMTQEEECTVSASCQINFSSICKEVTLKELTEKYGTPIKVTMPHYYGDFYFLAEEVDAKKRVVLGQQYKDGEPYRKKKYSFNDICSLYEEEINSNTVADQSSIDRDYNSSIKERIKSKDSFDEVKANNDNLMNHQKAGCLLASRYNKFAFFYDTGTGKTVMTLSIIKQKQIENDAHFLIIAPKAIIKTAWMDDSRDFFPELRILPISNNFFFEDYHPLYDRWKKHTKIPQELRINKPDWNKAEKEIDFSRSDWERRLGEKLNAQQDIIECMRNLADHYLVNIEKFRYDPDAIMDEYVLDGLVVDESAILKNYHSKSAQTLFEYADEFDYIYLLSGKPAPNNSTEYYAQMRLVDPNTFSMSFNNFKARYFAGSGSKIKPVSSQAEDEVANMVAVRSLIVSKDDCLTLPDIFQEIITFQLPEKIMEQYDRLYEYCIFALQANEKFEKGAYYSTTCKLAVFTKLREIASGFLIDEYGDTIGIHNLKTQELIGIVEKHLGQQMIVWCQFEYEIREVEKALSKYGKVVTAYGKTKNIDESISEFKNGNAMYIVAHPKSIKYGVTFVKCNLAVYYALSYSAEDYYQSRDRIHRLGQKNICTYYFIQAENTIDEIMFEAVQNKMSYAEIFSVIVKQAAKHGINYQDFKPDDEPPIRDELISTQNVKQKYEFALIEDAQFTFKYNKQERTEMLYNTMLDGSQNLRPEEILFEIGYVIKADEIEKQEEKERKNIELTYNDIIEVAKWVISEMKELNIRRIQKVYDYLEEQITKQYERDVANGAEELQDISELALKRTIEKRKKSIDDSEHLDKKKKFKFGYLGIAKRGKDSLMDIRREVDEVFFDSGKYRLTHNCFCGDSSVAHCHLSLGLIYIDKDDYERPTPESLFDLLHEIGHLETNTDGMSRQEEEVFATRWAMDRMKLYDFKLPRKRQKEFEDYINGFSSRRNKILTKKNATNFDWDE